MDVEFEVDVCPNDNLLNRKGLEHIACSSDDDDVDFPVAPVCIDLPEYSFDDNEEDSVPIIKKVVSQPKKLSRVDEVMKKCILGPGFEKLESVPMPQTSKKALRIKRKRERERTKGSNWFNLPAQEITEEVKNDLDLLRMRSIIDPKRFYKNNDITHTPKYFQVGTVVEAPADFYTGRISKAKRKKTLVDELLADADARQYQKKKFKAIVDSQRYLKGRKAYKQVNKKNKNK